MEKNKVQGLFKKYLDDSMTPEEFSQLYELIDRRYEPETLDELLEGFFSDSSNAVSAKDHDQKEVFAELLAKIRERDVEMYPRRWVAVAACIILLAGTLIYLRIDHGQRPIIAKTDAPGTNDVAPGHDGAILTLGSGEQIVLDSVRNGALATQGNVKITKLNNGQLNYTAVNGSPVEILYNKLTTPRARRTTVV